MKFDNKTLEGYLMDADKTFYKEKRHLSYNIHYASFVEHINLIHKSVVASANYHDAENGLLVYLNDHGIGHIQTVISRATELVKSNNLELNISEVYYLLLAIHIHDIGNIHGRKNHVDDLEKVLIELKHHMGGLDRIHIKNIESIAKAHGGETITGDKDKIALLPETISTMINPIRVRLLASILRLADEIADDQCRCDSNLIKRKDTDNPSYAYHLYSHCLTNVQVDHDNKQINYSFNIPLIYASTKINKINKYVYIIDEIHKRTHKTFHELIYTMRFTRGCIDLNKLQVDIEFESEYGASYSPEKITYSLYEQGYPELSIRLKHKSGADIAKEILIATNEIKENIAQ